LVIYGGLHGQWAADVSSAWDPWPLSSPEIQMILWFFKSMRTIYSYSRWSSAACSIMLHGGSGEPMGTTCGKLCISFLHSGNGSSWSELFCSWNLIWTVEQESSVTATDPSLLTQHGNWWN
jgi:hypothetical protein